MNCQPKNIKITGASVFLKLVERNAKATISSLQFLRWWAGALCVEMVFTQTLLRKENVTAEIKSFLSYFGIFEYHGDICFTQKLISIQNLFILLHFV